MHPTKNYFAEYKGDKRIFVETGTYKGAGIELAIEAEFEEIISIEQDRELALACINKYIEDYRSRVTIYIEESASWLEQKLGTLHEPILFWLDAHSQLLEDEPEMENPFPLLRELELIGKHPIKSHTILIDDILILTHPDVTGWSRHDIEQVLKTINPDYQLSYLPNPVKNNLLVAHL